VNAKIHESHVDHVKPGMKATIRVDAFSSEPLTGTVKEVATLPDSANFFSSDIKVYTTKVVIDNPSSGLRPGMNAEVKIMVDQHDNVLSVPVVAVLQYDSKDHVTRRVDDRYVQEEVELGIHNESFVEVLKGLKEHDVIVMDPVALMNDDARRKAFGSSGKAAVRDWAKRSLEEEPKGATGAPGAAPAGKGAVPVAKGGAGKKASGKRGAGGGFMNNPIFQKMQKNLTPEELASMRTASPEEREALQRKAGLTDEEIEQMAQMRRNMGAGRGGPGGGGPGGGGPGGGGMGGRRGGGAPGGDGGSDQ
jgi:HlyD family secretion protein